MVLIFMVGRSILIITITFFIMVERTRRIVGTSPPTAPPTPPLVQPPISVPPTLGPVFPTPTTAVLQQSKTTITVTWLSAPLTSYGLNTVYGINNVLYVQEFLDKIKSETKVILRDVLESCVDNVYYWMTGWWKVASLACKEMFSAQELNGVEFCYKFNIFLTDKIKDVPAKCNVDNSVKSIVTAL